MRTGDEYLESLRRRPRELYIGGERVTDVTTHPAFANVTRTVAKLYDLAADPANRDELTYADPQTGRRYNNMWLRPRSRADLTFLNDLYKDRAEKAGILYVDIWDGFMEESGDFSTFGPDVLGQVRRLRTGDGVNFTKAGARKLAHFVDREIKRLQQKATPVALPAPDETPRETAPAAAGPSGPSPRPVAGPVVPLTGGPAANESALAGASKAVDPASDSPAARVLVKGEAIPSAPGRADDFSWTPVSAASTQQDIAPLPQAAPPPPATRAAPPAPQQQRARPAPPRRAGGPPPSPTTGAARSRR